MKRFISLFLIIVLSLLSLYAATDIISSIYLVARYENFNYSSLGLIAGKVLFAAICLVFLFLLIKISRRRQVN